MTGYQHMTKAERATYQRAWRLHNPSLAREIAQRSYDKNRDSRSAYSNARVTALRADPATWAQIAIIDSRGRAKRAKLAHTITVDDVVVPARCPVFGTPFVFGAGKPTPRSPSLDRIVPSLGYVPGNVCVISYRANAIKRDASLEELRALVGYMEAHRG